MIRRGQAHTLEAVAAALLVLMSVFFVVQITAVTPLTASTANQHIENQEEAVARGLLATAASEQLLRPAVLRWNPDANRLPNTGKTGYYDSGTPPTTFGQTLDDTFSPSGLAYNVNFYYITSDGARHRQRFYYSGSPTSNAVTATRAVTIYDDDHIYNETGAQTTAVVGSSPYFAPDVAPNSHLYNVIHVEVVVWRM